MYHAKRLAFFGTVLVCTVLLTACPGKWPFVPGVIDIAIINILSEGSGSDQHQALCISGMQVSITSSGEKVFDIPLLAAKESFAGDRLGYMNVPPQLRTGKTIRIEVRCYGEENVQTDLYVYEDVVRYPVMSRSGAFLKILGEKKLLESCISGQVNEGWAVDRSLCVFTNLFSEQ